MDEASASLDFKTDMLIREFVTREFATCTVLTIAHRLNTVMDSTRIMVGHSITDYLLSIYR
jgi:ABC-type multidrug transport system fused ATPase/permease subunit